MDCDRARLLLVFDNPGSRELEDSDRARLRRHLDGCAGCRATADADRADADRLARAMKSVSSPSGARARLQNKLLAARGTWWRRTIVRGAAFATSLLLGSTLLWSQFGRPSFDAERIVLAANDQSGQGRTADEVRATTDEWLRAHDRRLGVPDDFDFKFQAFFAHTSFEGLGDVPTLVFVRGDSTARLYAVRESAFKNLRTADEQAVDRSGCTVSVRRYAASPGWVFVVVTTGAPVENFLRAAGTVVPT